MTEDNTVTKDSLYINLIQTISKNISNQEILDKITKTYLFIKNKHFNQKRATGEDYIIHLIETDKILSKLNVEPNTLIAGLLHDILEDTKVDFKELNNLFGQDIANLVKYCTKLSKLTFLSENINTSDNHQKIFLAIANDIRVVIIKIADRLHNMRTLKFLSKEKQLRIAKETLEIYVPLTHRLGLFEIKSELEDLCLRYINPQVYYHISALIHTKKKEREETIKEIINDIEKLFYNNNIQNFIIKGRIKNIYNIYKKINHKKLRFEEIFDLFAIRIIFDSVTTCYQSLGIIHSHYFPIPLKFKDYIAVPKPNLYQSLHTTILSKNGILCEIQIRTKTMDEIAEKGIASHWAYKENKVYSKETQQIEIAKKLRWYQELIKITQDYEKYPAENSKEFVNAIKNDILSKNVYVFTPKQKIIELPKGSTPIDFAFRIHTEIGKKIVGAIVNAKIVPLNYQLKNGDLVNIKTSKNNATFNKEWLRIVKTNHAKKKIKNLLYKYQTEYLNLIEYGKEIFEKEKNIQKQNNIIINRQFLNQYFKKYNFQSINDFYAEIGKKNILLKEVFDKKIDQDNIKNVMSNDIKKNIKKNHTNINIDGLPNIKSKLANCCTPILGDQIIGIITKTRGVTIHRHACLNVKKYKGQNLINVDWNYDIKYKYPAYIYIEGVNQTSLISYITNTINKYSINIMNLNIIKNKEITIIKLKILVNNIHELNNLINNFENCSNIHYIKRNYA